MRQATRKAAGNRQQGHGIDAIAAAITSAPGVAEESAEESGACLPAAPFYSSGELNVAWKKIGGFGRTVAELEELTGTQTKVQALLSQHWWFVHRAAATNPDFFTSPLKKFVLQTVRQLVALEGMISSSSLGHADDEPAQPSAVGLCGPAADTIAAGSTHAGNPADPEVALLRVRELDPSFDRYTVLRSGLTWEQLQMERTELARLYCSGADWYGKGQSGVKIWYGKSPGGLRVPVQEVKIQRCAFFKESGCPARIRWVKDVTTGKFTLETGDWEHADHRISTACKGLPKHLKEVMASPSKLALDNTEAMKAVRRLVGDEMNAPLQKKLKTMRKKAREKMASAVVPAELKGKYGGVHMFANSHLRSALEKSSVFGPHSAYVCGTPLIDAEDNRIAIAFSTENLLLNAYRQDLSSIQTHVQVDTTHRLVLEGHNSMVFGCVDAAQHFHVIGWGVCSHEDTAAHAHVIKCLKAEVESIVQQRVQDQQPI